MIRFHESATLIGRAYFVTAKHVILAALEAAESSDGRVSLLRITSSGVAARAACDAGAATKGITSMGTNAAEIAVWIELAALLASQ